MNWVQIYNRLFELINIQGDSYYGGAKFLNSIREVNYKVPSYSNYIEHRKTENKSTSRRDYYFDLLMEQPENERNNFSDSHSGNRAEKWVAIYIRDNVNSIVKMILNFI